MELPYDPIILLLVMRTNNLKTRYSDTYTPMFITAIFTVQYQKGEAIQMSINMDG